MDVGSPAKDESGMGAMAAYIQRENIRPYTVRIITKDNIDFDSNQHQYNNMHRKASVKEDAFIKLIKFAVTSGININRGASYQIL